MLTRLKSSAPEKPDVPRASVLQLMSLDFFSIFSRYNSRISACAAYDSRSRDPRQPQQALTAQLGSRHYNGECWLSDIACRTSVGGRAVAPTHPATDVWVGNLHVPVESPRADKGRIQRIGEVGRANHDDALLRLEAIELHLRCHVPRGSGSRASERMALCRVACLRVGGGGDPHERCVRATP